AISSKARKVFFTALNSFVGRSLEEIADGTVKIHPSPELKRETLVEKRELERLQAKMKEQLIKEQIAKEEAEEEAKQKNSRAAKAAAAE
ncbi:hypothetical protein ACI3RH_10120, partial [Lactococcus lactis]